MTVHISSHFDSGAIEVIDVGKGDDIRLAIRWDSHAKFRQWFHFRLAGVRGRSLNIRLINAGDCTYHYGWDGYQAVLSHDHQHWQRTATEYVGGELRIQVQAEGDVLWLAYFEPYSYERHQDYLGRWATDPRVSVEALGPSVDGRPIDLLTIGTPGAGKAPLWIVARQHPGESMAQWCAEGLVERLLDRQDAESLALLDRAVVYVVPNINPDGAIRGNLRSNAAGANLNREWMAPTRKRSPEVYAVRERMHALGVQGFLDLHGDETIPYVFVDGNGMLPNFTPRQAAEEAAFIADLLQVCPDFQTEHGYTADRFSDEKLTLASKYVGYTFGCLSLTLEMPFKDNNNRPDARYGWSGERSRQLGGQLLSALLRHLQRLA